MSRVKRVSTACTIVLALAGCAIDPGRPDDAKDFAEVAESRSGLATLYIYRPFVRIGRGVWPEVLLSGQRVVGLKNEGYTVVYLKPGRYSVSTEASAPLSGTGDVRGAFEIPAPGIYFLKYDRSYTEFTSYTGMYASPSFVMNYRRWVLVGREQALPEISNCYYLKPYVEIVGSD